MQTTDTGILLIQLGTPEAPTTSAVHRYLSEFLSDPRVVKISRWLWWPLLHGIILPLRSPRSAKLYKKIWTDEGSPLRVIAQRQQHALQNYFTQQARQAHLHVALGMRYGNPSIQNALKKLAKKNIQHLIVLPLYPQYSSTTTASAFDAVKHALSYFGITPQLHFIENYHLHPAYIAALAQSVRQQWQQHERGEKLIISFHGIPQRNVDAGDPYATQCHATAKQLAQTLQLKESEWMIVFQSRFGRAKWLTPYCASTLAQLPKTGVKRIDVICPGFSADCLETLEEIQIQNRAIFMQAGGEVMHYIPALNDAPKHIAALAEIVCTEAS